MSSQRKNRPITVSKLLPSSGGLPTHRETFIKKPTAQNMLKINVYPQAKAPFPKPNGKPCLSSWVTGKSLTKLRQGTKWLGRTSWPAASGIRIAGQSDCPSPSVCSRQDTVGQVFSQRLTPHILAKSILQHVRLFRLFHHQMIRWNLLCNMQKAPKLFWIKRHCGRKSRPRKGLQLPLIVDFMFPIRILGVVHNTYQVDRMPKHLDHQPRFSLSLPSPVSLLSPQEVCFLSYMIIAVWRALQSPWKVVYV